MARFMSIGVAEGRTMILFWIAIGLLFLRPAVAAVVLLREAWENR